MGYIVTARMALIDRQDGTTVPVLQGAPVPGDVTPAALTHLLALGMVREGDVEGGLAPTVPGDPVVPPAGPGPVADQPADPVGDGGPPADPVGDGQAPSGQGGGGDLPRKTALKPEWVAAAVARGVDPAEADALTKEELIERLEG